MVKRILLLCVGLCLVSRVPARAQFNEYVQPEYYLQYLPLIGSVSLGWFGVQSEHGTLDRCIELGFGLLAETAFVQPLKHYVDEVRPDGSAHNSFPSGHTAMSFTGAELVRMEYGWGWGAGAYAVAASVGALRVYHNRHYVWDVCAGAGFGILSAHIGGWLLEPTRKLLGLDSSDEFDLAFAPVYDPLSGTVSACLALSF